MARISSIGLNRVPVTSGDIPPKGTTVPIVQSYEQGIQVSAGDDVTVPLPSGTEDGDLLISITQYRAGDWVAIPSGWTSILTTSLIIDGLAHNIDIRWKEASSEPSSYTWEAETRSQLGSLQ
jgi:Tfp pilus assembly protein PilV